MLSCLSQKEKEILSWVNKKGHKKSVEHALNFHSGTSYPIKQEQARPHYTDV
jgi:alpha-D-ribose 1-methylphosphonate 5-triphosphate synthase subunit PhnH